MEIDLANCTQRTIYSISLSFYPLFVRLYSFPSIKPTAIGLNVHFCFQLVQLFFFLSSLVKKIQRVPFAYSQLAPIGNVWGHCTKYSFVYQCRLGLPLSERKSFRLVCEFDHYVFSQQQTEEPWIWVDITNAFRRQWINDIVCLPTCAFRTVYLLRFYPRLKHLQYYPLFSEIFCLTDIN